MKYLNGKELAEYVKERQAKEVRRLKAAKIQPRLAIISEGQNDVNDLYLKVKQQYGRDIGVEVELVRTQNTADSKKAVLRLNEDDAVYGIIVQLPLVDIETTDEVVNLIETAKDVDGLGADADYESATATAIMWLLAGYNVDLRGKVIAVVGRGRLVGEPLVRMLQSMDIEPVVLDETSQDFKSTMKQADIVVSATGQPGLITSNIVKPKAAIIDAGTTNEGGQLKGDVSDEVYERDDIAITPRTGGVGPLTVSALFDNVLRAARAKVGP